MPLLARVPVNFEPLNGTWDGQHWDRQTARCSNDFMSGPNPQVPPAGTSALTWDIESPEADSIVFNVSVDLPGPDAVLYTGLSNGVETTYLQAPAPNAQGADGTPFYNDVPWAQFYERGIYIASVEGASQPFFININGV
jgi:hypothetical protein